MEQLLLCKRKIIKNTKTQKKITKYEIQIKRVIGEQLLICKKFFLKKNTHTKENYNGEQNNTKHEIQIENTEHQLMRWSNLNTRVIS